MKKLANNGIIRCATAIALILALNGTAMAGGTASKRAAVKSSGASMTVSKSRAVLKAGRTGLAKAGAAVGATLSPEIQEVTVTARPVPENTAEKEIPTVAIIPAAVIATTVINAILILGLTAIF